jgi:hypothetical protein
MAHPSRLYRRVALALSAILIAGLALVSTLPVFATDDGQAEATLTGVVTGEGTGLPGITVTLDGVGDAVTGPDGGFQFSHLVAGSGYALSTFDAATVWATGSASGTLVEGDNQLPAIDLSRVTLPGISGTVVSGGMPLVDIFVEVTGGAATPSATTSSDGAFTFNGLGAGTYSLTFRDVTGFWQSTTVDGVVVGATSVDLGTIELSAAPVAEPPTGSGDTSLIQAVTEPGVISGVITDRASGDPLPQASVNAIQGRTYSSVLAGNDGSFTITNLPLGTYSLTASAFGSAPGWQSQTVSVTLTDSAPAVVRDIALRKIPTGAGAFTGVLTDESGDPIANLTVNVVKVGSRSGGIASVQTDSSGVFRKDGLVSGSYSISVPSNDYERIPYRSSIIEVDATQPAADYGTIVLKRYRTGDGSVRGVVRDEVTGTTVAGMQVMVTLKDSSQLPSLATTNSEGVWSLDALPYGTYELTVGTSAGGVNYESTYPSVLQISSNVRVDRVDTIRSVPAGTGSVRGEIRDAITHLPVVGATVYVDRSAGGSRTFIGTTDALGVFTVTGLPVGGYSVNVDADGYQQDSSGVTVGAGEASIRVSLVPFAPEPAQVSGTAGLRGTLTDPDGLPLDGVDVYVSSDQGSLATPYAETDASGRYSFSGLPAGEVSVSVWVSSLDSSYVPFTRSLALIAGSVTTLDIELAESASVEGFATVDPALGSGIRPVVLAIPVDGDDPFAYFPVDEQTGYYSVHGLAAGEYLLYFAQLGDASSGTGIAPAYWRDGVATGAVDPADATPVTVRVGQVLTGRNITLTAGGAIHGTVAVDAPGGVTPLPSGKMVIVSVYELTDTGWYEQPVAVGYALQGGSYMINGLAPGSYRLQFGDEWETNRAFVRKFSGGALTFQTASTITVTAGQTADAGHVALGLVAPTTAGGAIDLSRFAPDALDALEDQITVASGATAGSPTIIGVGAQFAGEWVSVWANSTPTALGSWTRVSSAGTVSVTIPSTLSGSHRIAVQDADSQTIGWASATIAPATTTPSTPTQPGQPSQPSAPGTSTSPVSSGASSAPAAPSATTPTGAPTSTPTPAPSATAVPPVDEQLPTLAEPTPDQRTAAPDFAWAPLLLIAVVLLTGVVMLIILRRRPV